jgi:hypothetical protein
MTIQIDGVDYKFVTYDGKRFLELRFKEYSNQGTYTESIDIPLIELKKELELIKEKE